MNTKTQDFEAAREKMIKGQLIAVGIDNTLFLEAIRTVPKDKFVPKEFKPITYSSKEIPLSKERAILEPMVTGKMVKFANVTPEQKLLMLGDASGYFSTLMTFFTKKITLVEKPEYCETIRATLAQIEVDGINLIEGKLSEGCKANAPYDVIFICGVIKQISDEVKAQVAKNGFIISFRKKGYICEMVKTENTEEGFVETILYECTPFTLPDFPMKSSFNL